MSNPKELWLLCALLGAAFWTAGIILWLQKGLDETILFAFNPMRIEMAPLVTFSRWLTVYGMAAITTILIFYLIASKFTEVFDAPQTIYFYTICSFGLSGIAGDLIKLAINRPRPVAIYGDQILALSDSITAAIPSGHATKSIALALPFILLVKDSKIIHKGIKLLIGALALGVCFSRIILGAHFVSDVLAGIGTALIGLPLSMLFANIPLSKMKQEQLPKVSFVWGFLLIFLTVIFLLI
jgi:membrane-associated phospholipid phosphatase